MFHNNSQFEKKSVYKKILFKMPATKIKTKQTTQQNLLGKTYQRKWKQESEDGGAREGRGTGGGKGTRREMKHGK